jgi:superfamily II helicase
MNGTRENPTLDLVQSVIAPIGIEKRCKRCEIYKELTEFTKTKKIYCGYVPVCKKCASELKCEKYPERKEEISKRAKIWRDNNKQYVKGKHIKWRIDNPMVSCTLCDLYNICMG